MISIFPRKLVYTSYEKVINNKTFEYLDLLRKTQWLSEEELRKFQWSKLTSLLKHAYRDVPYYKSLFDSLGLDVKNGISIEEFRRIPLLNKEIITNNREKLLSARFRPSDLFVDMTSGSTGKKLIFYREKNGVGWAQRNATGIRSMEWLELDRFEKQAELWGSQIERSNVRKIKGKVYNFLFQTLFLSSYNLTPQMMSSYTEKIKRFKPKVLRGYPSALYLYANYLDKNQTEIKGIKYVISSAETMYPYQREIIEKAFNCKVIEIYGCREFGLIAQECTKHNGFHIIAEHVFVEILDEEGYPCKPGKRGKIIITDLDNYGFPFIRYDIGDIGILSNKKCLCGRGLPLIEKIEGRTWDVIVGANGNQLVGSFWLVKDIEGIIQFQVIQEEFDKLILKLVVDKFFTEAEKLKLLTRVYDNCGKDMKVDIQLLDKIPIPDSGKHKYIISKVSPFIK
jgi:phenylacetate-CoA ligase